MSPFETFDTLEDAQVFLLRCVKYNRNDPEELENLFLDFKEHAPKLSGYHKYKNGHKYYDPDRDCWTPKVFIEMIKALMPIIDVVYVMGQWIWIDPTYYFNPEAIPELPSIGFEYSTYKGHWFNAGDLMAKNKGVEGKYEIPDIAALHGSIEIWLRERNKAA